MDWIALRTWAWGQSRQREWSAVGWASTASDGIHLQTPGTPVVCAFPSSFVPAVESDQRVERGGIERSRCQGVSCCPTSAGLIRCSGGGSFQKEKTFVNNIKRDVIYVWKYKHIRVSRCQECRIQYNMQDCTELRGLTKRTTGINFNLSFFDKINRRR